MGHRVVEGSSDRATDARIFGSPWIPNRAINPEITQEKADPVKIVALHECVKSIRAVRRRIARCSFDDEVAFCRFEPGPERGRALPHPADPSGPAR